jgi:hypothetical protein
MTKQENTKPVFLKNGKEARLKVKDGKVTVTVEIKTEREMKELLLLLSDTDKQKMRI